MRAWWLLPLAAALSFRGYGVRRDELLPERKVALNGTHPAYNVAGSGLPQLGSAWYINLDDFTGRRVQMEAAYTQAHLRYQRFAAVRPSMESVRPGGKWVSLYNKFHPSRQHEIDHPLLHGKIRGEIGCIASHLELLKHLKATGRPGQVYLLAEDDYAPVPDFATRLPTVLAHLPADWDTLRFDCWDSNQDSLKVENFPQVQPGLFHTGIQGCTPKDGQPGGRPECHFCGGTHAVLVPYEKIDKIIGLWSGMDGPLFPLDCMLTRPDFVNLCLQWHLFQKIEHLHARSGIPKRQEDITEWHLNKL